MATFNEIKQKLIDRVDALASTASAPDVNFLSKTLDQVDYIVISPGISLRKNKNLTVCKQKKCLHFYDI